MRDSSSWRCVKPGWQRRREGQPQVLVMCNRGRELELRTSQWELPLCASHRVPMVCSRRRTVGVTGFAIDTVFLSVETGRNFAGTSTKGVPLFRKQHQLDFVQERMSGWLCTDSAVQVVGESLSVCQAAKLTFQTEKNNGPSRLWTGTHSHSHHS